MVGGIENEGESMPKTRKRHPASLKVKFWKVTFGAVTVLVTALGLLPLFLSISIQPPRAVFSDQPFGVLFEIKNDFFLPMRHLKYECLILYATTDLYSSRTSARPLGQEDRNLPWQESMTCHCEDVFQFEPHIKFLKGEVGMRIDFYSFPWLWLSHVERSFEAVIDPKTGNVLHWTPKGNLPFKMNPDLVGK
jgi:hypothetical protein